MDKGTQIYQKLIDELAEMSQECAGQQWALKGRAVGTDEYVQRLNELFPKLTDDERKTLAEFALNEYMSGMFDTLAHLEWYIDCEDMKITVGGEELPTQKYNGLSGDFIGRRDEDDKWEWD